MRLYLLRHADAVDQAPTDAARELTARGLAQARTVGAFCVQRALRPDLVLTSPYRRAVQTAELAAAALGQGSQTVPFLASGMTPETALDELRAYQRFTSLLLVGHQPDLGLLAAALLGLRNDAALPVGKASLTCLEGDRLTPGSARLRFFLPVEMMASHRLPGDAL